MTEDIKICNLPSDSQVTREESAIIEFCPVRWLYLPKLKAVCGREKDSNFVCPKFRLTERKDVRSLRATLLPSLDQS